MNNVSDSPLTKKLKLSANGDAVEQSQPASSSGPQSGSAPAKRELNMAAPLPSQPSTLQADGPPAWFIDFEKRQRSEFESLLDHKLDLKLRDLVSKVAEHEDKIQNLTFENQSLKDSVKLLKEENLRIDAKLDDLENRHRRQNLVVFGLQETDPGRKEDSLKVVTNFLHCVGARKEDISQIERCHRTPTHVDSTSSNTKPRRIHMFFGSYMARERVRKAAIDYLKKSKSMYEEQRVFVAEDLSKKVLALRREKRPIFLRLKEEGKRPFFIYPARIGYREAVSGKLTIVDK